MCLYFLMRIVDRRSNLWEDQIVAFITVLFLDSVELSVL